MPSTKSVQAQTNTVVEPQLGADNTAVDFALGAWRHKAGDVLLAAVAAAHLPVVVLGCLGHGPPMGPLAKRLGLGIYLVVAAAALFRRIDYRKRLLASFLVTYVGLVVTNFYYPHGPYSQAVITVPVFALVLLGPAAARTAIVASTAIIVLPPFLGVQPGIVRVLGIDPAGIETPAGLVWFRTTVMAASLFALMLLLDRFHAFLLDTLRQRIEAQRKIEDDMRERHRLQREIAAIGDGERRRLGQELHDSVCQQVTAAMLRCQAMERRVERGGTLSNADLAPLSSLLAETIDDAHSVARGLCPLEPEPEALAPALRALTRRTQELTGVRCEFMTKGVVRVPDAEAAQHLYRIGQEALSNAARHAKAGRIAVELRASDDELMLLVEDDGTGLPPELPSGGMGLRSMAYRAQILEGELTVGPAHGGGTRIICRVPLPQGVLAAGHHA